MRFRCWLAHRTALRCALGFVVSIGAAPACSSGFEAGTGGSSSGAPGGDSDGGVPGASTGGASGDGDGAGGRAASGGADSDTGAGSGGSGSGGAGAGGTGGSETPFEPVPVTVYLAGDSTVSSYADTASTRDQAGWGQMLHELLDPLATVDNRAIGGRTARRFIDDGALAAIWGDIAAGDYLLVQFGTNDGNKTATYTFDGRTIPYYLEPATDFKTYLMQYVDGARERGATPVFVTPPPRNSAYCTGGNGTGGHAQAMRDLGAAENVPVLDLNTRTVNHLKAICPAPTPEDFFFSRADSTVDGTHFQENGARYLASFVVAELSETELALAAYVVE